MNKVPIFKTVLPEIAADHLKILGTGGLSKPGKRHRQLHVDRRRRPGNPQRHSRRMADQRPRERRIFAEVKDKHSASTPKSTTAGYRIKPQQDRTLETFAVGYFDDARARPGSLGRCRGQSAITIKLPPQPVGYCTWYHAGAWNEKAIVKQTEIAAKELKPFGFNFMQIDDGWQDGLPKPTAPRKNFTRVRSERPLSLRHEAHGRHDRVPTA